MAYEGMDASPYRGQMFRRLGDDRDQIIRRLCPHLSQPEKDIAAERFDRYVDLLCRIALRIATDTEAAAALRRLTASEDHPTMESDEGGPVS